MVLLQKTLANPPSSPPGRLGALFHWKSAKRTTKPSFQSCTRRFKPRSIRWCKVSCPFAWPSTSRNHPLPDLPQIPVSLPFSILLFIRYSLGFAFFNSLSSQYPPMNFFIRDAEHHLCAEIGAGCILSSPPIYPWICYFYLIGLLYLTISHLETTEGIDVSEFQVTIPDNDDPLLIRTWDFAGNSHFLPLHFYFLYPFIPFTHFTSPG